MSDTPRTVAERITDYLTGGGLFNPELANHTAVRDLLIAARDELAAAKEELAENEGVIKIWRRRAEEAEATNAMLRADIRAAATARVVLALKETEAALDAAIDAAKPQ